MLSGQLGVQGQCQLRPLLTLHPRVAYLHPRVPTYKPKRHCIRRAPGRLLVCAEALSNKGTRFKPSEVEVKRILGEGSYGAAYEVCPHFQRLSQCRGMAKRQSATSMRTNHEISTPSNNVC